MWVSRYRAGVALCPTFMVQGTASSVGKSLLVAGLCRYFRRLGVRVAPFKSQNMALNSYATSDGLEVGRAQAMQADAARVPVRVEMNPILLKPEAGRAQVVLMGRPQDSLDADQYFRRQAELRGVIERCLCRLRSDFDLVILEGAGSPAEINLRERDIANMFVAELADAPVLLAGDIDRGGVFAALHGTLSLLSESERARVAGLVINKFRGDLGLLEPGLQMLAEHCGKPVLGVVPFVPGLRLADEDSVALETREGASQRGPGDILEIVVLRFPHISNFDDVLALEHEPGVRVRFSGDPGPIARADLVILPGSKSSRADLRWMRERALDEPLRARVDAGGLVLGICGGYQMLGERIADPLGIEGEPGECTGLGLLPCTTEFARDKVVKQVEAVPEPSFLSDGEAPLSPCAGYEIHVGRVSVAQGSPPLLRIDGASEGCVGQGGRVIGTLVHGLLDSDALRRRLLANLRRRRGLDGDEAAADGLRLDPDAEYDRLADVLAEALDRDALHRLAGL